MKTKRDIFDEHSLIYYYSDSDQVEAEVTKVFDAVDEYAKEVAIDFIKWVNDDYVSYENGNIFLKHSDHSRLNPLSPNELFELYIKEKQ